MLCVDLKSRALFPPVDLEGDQWARLLWCINKAEVYEPGQTVLNEALKLKLGEEQTKHLIESS